MKIIVCPMRSFSHFQKLLLPVDHSVTPFVSEHQVASEKHWHLNCCSYKDGRIKFKWSGCAAANAPFKLLCLFVWGEAPLKMLRCVSVLINCSGWWLGVGYQSGTCKTSVLPSRQSLCGTWQLYLLTPQGAFVLIWGVTPGSVLAADVSHGALCNTGECISGLPCVQQAPSLLFD